MGGTYGSETICFICRVVKPAVSTVMIGLLAVWTSELVGNWRLELPKARIPRRRHRLAHILTSDTRDFPKLSPWQAERHADILATILAREDVGVVECGPKDRKRWWARRHVESSHSVAYSAVLNACVCVCVCVVQRIKLVDEINEDIHQLRVDVETLKQYHQDDGDGDGDDGDDDDGGEKADEGKDKDQQPNDDDAAAG